MRVFIHRPDDTVFSINRQVALVGFNLRGEDVHLFDSDAFDNLSIKQDDIVVGGVGYVHRALKRLGFLVPELASIPPQLAEFAGRKVWCSTMIEARRAVESGKPLFVKPLPTQLKLFTGRPLLRFSDLLSTANVPDDTVVECSELTPFVSEFRVFVLHHEVVGVRHYGGDPLVFPDSERIKAAIAAYADAPAGYALDMGVCEDGRTLLVEVNDGYAVGSYGLTPTKYATLIDARWAQLRMNKNTQT